MDKYIYKKGKCTFCKKEKDTFKSKEEQGNQKDWICLNCFFK